MSNYIHIKRHIKRKLLTFKPFQKAKQALVFIHTILFSSTVLANPILDNIASGEVAIQQSASSMVVQQSSQKAILNWQSFNIGQNESTHFQQPAGGIALNRINPDQGASQIYGRLTATGDVILLNGSGIHFGPSAYVNVGNLIAGTSHLSDQNFLNAYYQFSPLSPYTGSIVNEGQLIAANHGLIALLGAGVSNSGHIEAHMGKIVLASGSAFTMNFSGNELVHFSVDESAKMVGVDQDGKSLESGVTNTGKLIANGGSIQVTAKTAASVLDNAINMSGIAEAKAIGVKNGEIILMAHSGTTKVSGKLDVSGKNSNEKGGQIKILGNKVALYEKGIMDASGDQGGGEVLMGGNFQGKGPELNAQYTFFSRDAWIDASALTSGEGGKVIVWSDFNTKFYGTILAHGGIQGGNGGFVETSGGNLVFEGHVDVASIFGKAGTILLDPDFIYIVNGSGGDFDSYLDSGNAIAFGEGTETGTVSVDKLRALGDVNITLQAKKNIYVGDSADHLASVNLSGLYNSTFTLQAGDSATVGGGHVIFKD